MMNEWGIPTFYLEALAYRFAEKLASKGLRVPGLSMAGRFSEEAGIFQAIAMGAPHVKAVCMGRVLTIPGMVGKNIGQSLRDSKLSKTVSKYGKTTEDIVATYDTLKSKYGKKIENIPLGAVGIHTFCQRLRIGLQQLMAGSRNFNLSTVSQKDIMALTEEAAKISGIPYIMDAYREEAEETLA